MKTNNKHKKTKIADLQHYDNKNKQKQVLPVCISATTHREGYELPAIENLNQQEELKDLLEKPKNKDSDDTMTKNQESLYGVSTKTDLGNGQKTGNKNEKEMIIRTRFPLVCHLP